MKNLCLPALLFHTTATATLDEIWHPGFIAVISIGSLAVFFATLLYRLRGRELADASIDGLSAAYANTGYIGIPLCVLVLGDDEVERRQVRLKPLQHGGEPRTCDLDDLQALSAS
mgnify:CR=1 FL=1